MQFLNFYKDRLKRCTENQVFDYFIETLKPSNILWSYFVNWEKVLDNARDLELPLNTLNYLIGKVNFDDEFRHVLKKHPEVAKTLPALVVRDGDNTKDFKILVDYKKKKLVYEQYNFDKDKLTGSDIDLYLTFAEKTGLKSLLMSKKIKNLVDYIIGVEAGIDSNARKNRSGTAMQDIVGFFIEDTCTKNGYKCLPEANADKIKDKFGYDVPVDKSSRRYDFAIDNGEELFLVETNFYSGGGSKLKSTAGEYRNLFDVLNGKYKFIWITDGNGWLSTTRPLRETFNHNDYIFNLDMIENGVLESILSIGKADE